MSFARHSKSKQGTGNILGRQLDSHWLGRSQSPTDPLVRVLGKFAFSLSQDWELPIKRELNTRCGSDAPAPSDCDGADRPSPVAA
ncbi:hypothetical protein EK904_008236 [Melospiza melodia maxima]|nr:hypothetical protein EK904_008236 [Melospiza melodia maxima]